MDRLITISDMKGSELKQTLQRIEQQLEQLANGEFNNQFEKPCNVKQAAEFLGCTAATIREKAKARLLPHHRLIADQGKMYFFKSELSEFIKHKKVKTIQEIDNLATEFVNTI